MPSCRLTEDVVAGYRRCGAWTGYTLVEHALELAAARPRAPVFFHENGTIDLQTLLADAEALAVALHELGLRPGDVIAFQLPNWEEAAVINLAACRLGLVCNPLVPIYRDAELTFMLNDSRSKVVFIAATFRGFEFDAMYARLGAALVHQPLIVTVRAERADGLSYESLLAAGRGRELHWPLVQPESVKLLLYTSGTTGRPKAVLHSHETLARAIRTSVAHWGIGAGDVILMPSPVTHATGYANALEMPLLHGTRTVLMDRWDAAAAVRLIRRYQVTATVGATPFLKELVAAATAAGTDLPELRIFACGGAAVPPELIHEANRVLCSRPAFRVYGSSEAPYVALGRPAGSDPAAAAITDGQVVDYEIRIVDDAGQDLPAGADGEILVRGPALFLGYASDADNADCFSADGWFRTGDLGRLDGDRWLTITGRKKDLIIRGGENISAKEIEDLLHGHPAIAEAAVVAMPHARLGEGVFAFVITLPAQTLTLDAVLEHLRRCGLARQKHPERMAVVTEFPRTPSGKIRKDQLRLMAAAIVNSH